MGEFLPRKVAVLLPSLKFGGTERVALNLARELKRLGVQVDIVLISKQGEFLAEAEEGFKVVDLRCSRTYQLPFKLFQYVLGHRPDVLVSSFWKLNLCACLVRMVFTRFKLLLWEHSPPSKSTNSPGWLYAPSASLFYRWANKVVAVSTGVYNDIDRLTIGLRSKLVVIFNPITPPKEQLSRRRTSGLAKQVIWIGRLDAPKNPGLMLETFALLTERCAATLVFVGDGPLRPELENRCLDLGLQDRISFLGFRSNPYEYLTTSDLLVLSSDREGLGNVIIEAMYCGLRVVSTDCGGGIRDILLDNQYGTIVPSMDKVAMAKAIEKELTTTHANQNQVDGAQRFLPEVIVKQFLMAMG